MKLGVLTALFGDQPLASVLEYVKNAGLEAIELGAGNFASKAHCDPDVLLNDDKELLFTLPFRNNYGWIMEDCQGTMHSREFDVMPGTVRYSLIFWYDYKAR